MMGQLKEDLRTAVRSLRRWPALSFTAVAILAIGIGANTAVFSLASQLVDQPSPYREPERLVMLFEMRPKLVTTPQRHVFETWRDQSRSLEEIVAYGLTWDSLATEHLGIDAAGGVATPGFFRFLGVTPMLGRGLDTGDGEGSSSQVVVLTHGLWRELYGGDRQSLGRFLSIGGQDYEVVGVLPKSFRFHEDPSLRFWIPPSRRPGEDLEPRGVLARLRPGVTPEMAEEELSTITATIQDELWAGARHLRDPKDSLRAFAPLWVVTGCVLLIVCGTVASLLLARGELRANEIVIRAALGAGRRRLTLQLLTESLVLAVLGGGLGLVLALWISDALPPLLPFTLSDFDFEGSHLNPRHLAFTATLSLVAGLLCGLIPSWQTSVPNLASVLQQSGTSGSSKRRILLRQSLVVTEVAMAFSLLLGVLLLASQVLRWHWQDPGFEPEGLWSLRLDLPKERYGTWEERAAFYDHVLDDVAARELPPAASISLGGGLGSKLLSQAAVRIEPGCTPVEEEEQYVTLAAAAPSYFEVVGLPLRQGRGFEPQDRTSPEKLVVINTALAERYWPDSNPVGQQIGFSLLGCRRIVGVANNLYTLPNVSDDDLGVYLPSWEPGSSLVSLLIRSPAHGPAIVESLRERIQQLEPGARFTTLPAAELLHSPQMERTTRYLLLMACFVALAILLTALGIYSVVTYSVNRRRQEIGVRMTFGARRSQILRSALFSGLRPVGLGVLTGLGLVMILGRIAESSIFGLELWRTSISAATALLLLALSALAAWAPAWRATRVDPAQVLRRD